MAKHKKRKLPKTSSHNNNYGLNLKIGLSSERSRENNRMSPSLLPLIIKNDYFFTISFKPYEKSFSMVESTI